ncbi:MAG: translation initiation factor [Myxococcales bacterium]|nr:translation initiation factor [Myxococcales bacterium]
MSRKKNPPIDTSGAGFGGSLGDLLKARGLAPTEPAPAPPAAAPPAAAGATLASCGRLHLSASRRGRGGKTVTLVDGLAPLGEGLDALAQQLRRALGVGGAVEGEQVVLQGDCRDRAAAWLRAQGARDVRVAP